MIKRHTYLRVDQGNTLKLCHDIAKLRLIPPQELAASRHIEEEVLHGEDTALITGILLDRLHRRANDHQVST